MVSLGPLQTSTLPLRLKIWCHIWLLLLPHSSQPLDQITKSILLHESLSKLPHLSVPSARDVPLCPSAEQQQYLPTAPLPLISPHFHTASRAPFLNLRDDHVALQPNLPDRVHKANKDFFTEISGNKS